VIRPDGNRGIYGVVEFAPAVAVVPLTADEQVYLVGQHRYATDCYSWEIVSGYADAAEDLAIAAKRELAEEVGLAARRWDSLGRCHISNSVTDQVGHIFLARDLQQGVATPDPTEALATTTVPLVEAMRMAQESEIVQAFSLVGLYRAWRFLREEAPARR
jgi:8-oxo-dGTP pyrophosphatase MutT (NUDIX family)